MSGSTDIPNSDIQSTSVETKELKPLSPVLKVVYLVLAAVFFVLALIGVAFPGIPTTPFLLLTSYLLVRSSPKLNQKLLDSKWFGPILRDWQIKGGVRQSIKLKTLLLIGIVVPLTIVFTPAPDWAKLAIGLLALVGVIVVIRLPVVQ